MTIDKKEYDWVDDPFKEQSQIEPGMSRNSKVFVGCGCILAVVVLVVLIILFWGAFMSLVGS